MHIYAPVPDIDVAAFSVTAVVAVLPRLFPASPPSATSSKADNKEPDERMSITNAIRQLRKMFKEWR
jgi:hypothetical protein